MKRWIAAGVAALLLTAPAVATAGGVSCYYDPRTMMTFGCNNVDARMLGLKYELLAAYNGDDDGTFWTTLRLMTDLEQSNGGTYLASEGSEVPEPLHIHASDSLRSHQVLDSLEAGANIRYATLPGPDGTPRLAYWDRLGRPMKVSGMFHTSSAEHWVDETLSYGWGVVGGWAVGAAPVTANVAKLVGFAIPAWVGAAGDGYLMNEALGHVATMPEAGDTTILIDVVTPEGDDQVVYRNWVTVGEDGKITAHKMKNGTYWQRLGVINYDEDGNPVW